GRGKLDAAGKRQGEPASLPWSALHMHLPLQQSGEVPGNGKAQPGTAVLSRARGIGLLERPENLLQLPFSNSRARVPDGECDPVVSASGQVHRNFALVRELNGVREEVPQHLFHALKIGGDRREDLILNDSAEFQAFLSG